MAEGGAAGAAGAKRARPPDDLLTDAGARQHRQRSDSWATAEAAVAVPEFAFFSWPGRDLDDSHTLMAETKIDRDDPDYENSYYSIFVRIGDPFTVRQVEVRKGWKTSTFPPSIPIVLSPTLRRLRHFLFTRIPPELAGGGYKAEITRAVDAAFLSTVEAVDGFSHPVRLPVAGNPVLYKEPVVDATRRQAASRDAARDVFKTRIEISDVFREAADPYANWIKNDRFQVEQTTNGQSSMTGGVLRLRIYNDDIVTSGRGKEYDMIVIEVKENDEASIYRRKVLEIGMLEVPGTRRTATIPGIWQSIVTDGTFYNWIEPGSLTADALPAGAGSAALLRPMGLSKLIDDFDLNGGRVHSENRIQYESMIEARRRGIGFRAVLESMGNIPGSEMNNDNPRPDRPYNKHGDTNELVRTALRRQMDQMDATSDFTDYAM